MMHRTLALTLATVMSVGGAVAASPADVKVTLENTVKDEILQTIRAIVRVENVSAAPITLISVECVFMNGMDQAVDVAIETVFNLPAGASTYVTPTASLVGSMIQQQCYLDGVQ